MSSQAPQWHDLSSTAPEVVSATGKEVAHDEQKEVALGHGPEVVPQDNYPEAIDDDCDKEVVIVGEIGLYDDLASGVQWFKSRPTIKLTVLAIVLLVAITIGLGAGLGVTLDDKFDFSRSL